MAGTRDSRAQLSGTVIDVPVGDGAIRAEALGDGPVLLLLHGWTLDRRLWRPQMAALAGRFRLIAIDRRGFGQSTAPPGLAREIADIVAVADALGVERFILVGMSQAGRVALRFALDHPTRLSGLVLQGSPLSGVPAAPGEEEAIPLGHFTELVAAGALDAMKRLWQAHPLMQSANPEARRLLATILRDYAGRDLAHRSPTLAVRPADLAALAMPTLVITGAQDTPWRRKVADLLARTLAHAERTTIEEAGHACNLCQPAAFNRRLARFCGAR